MTIDTLRDMRADFGPARDQGVRPTCLAFAASDSHAALRPPFNPLSCEFAFYHAQKRAGRALSSGSLLTSILTTLEEEGQPIESDWPYFDKLPGSVTSYEPPRGLTVFRRRSETPTQAIDAIINHLLSGGDSLLLVMTISDAFYTPDADGVVRAPAAELPDPTRRHAVVAVGCGRVNGSRAILIRNSWGMSWGVDGHAWLLEPYLTPRLSRTALLTEDVDVS